MISTNPSTPQAELARFGLTGLWNPSDPLLDTYNSIAANYKTAKTPGNFMSLAIASMIARQFLYFKKSPGDCGIPTSSYSTGNAAIQIGSQAIQQAGIPILGQILSIFGQHHAQAVATEQTLDCQVSGTVNAAWAQLDSYAASGQMDSATVLKGVESIRQQAISQLTPIAKDCNTPCVSIRIINCISDLRKFLYQNAAQNPSVTNGIAAIGSSLSKTNGISIAAIAAVAGAAVLAG